MTAPSEDDFRAEVLAFLRAHGTPRTEGRALARDVTPDRVSLPVVGAVPPEQEQAELAAARAWRQLRFDNGLGWITGPVELGGRGLPASYERLEALGDFDEQSFEVRRLSGSNPRLPGSVSLLLRLAPLRGWCWRRGFDAQPVLTTPWVRCPTW